MRKLCGVLWRVDVQCERGGKLRPLRVKRCVQVERCAAMWMRQLQAAGVQHQAQRTVAFGKDAVLAVVAVGGVANDGVKNVLQVAA